MINRLSLSLLILFLGFVFYAYRINLNGFLFSSGGTFLHVIALTLLSSNFVKDRNIKYISLLWVGINIIFEYSQMLFSYATFDYFDILASFLALPIAFILAYNTPKFEFKMSLKKPLLLFSLAIGSGLIMGSYTPEDECKYEFVYQELLEFRNSISVEDAQEVGDISSTHIYGNYIFLVEFGKGIHIFDQTNIEDIKNIRFIKIPGVLHVEVQDQHIYADSLMDLVIIDITDIQNITFASRLNDVFAYNPWDIVNIKGADQYEFCSYPSYEYELDGVVTGYKENTKWDI